jgi:hypothetical protein
MKKLLLLSACLWLLVGPAQAQTAPVSIAVVRIYENVKNITTTITTGEAKSEVLEFKASSFKTSDQEINENLYKLLRRFYNEGYKLQSNTTIMSSPSASTRELIFIKS